MARRRVCSSTNHPGVSRIAGAVPALLIEHGQDQVVGNDGLNESAASLGERNAAADRSLTQAAMPRRR